MAYRNNRDFATKKPWHIRFIRTFVKVLNLLILVIYYYEEG